MAPSDAARELVRGAFDLHVHIDPDVIPRRIDDVSLAHRFAELGLAGFQLKSHYTSTAERAKVVDRLVPEVKVLGAVALNQAAGRTEPQPGAKLPAWAKLQHELRDRGIRMEPVPVLTEDGAVVEALRDVLATVVLHGMVLATGHLGRDEIFAVVDAAREEGVQDIVITHPEFPSQSLSTDDQRALAAKGALLERCFTTPHTGKVAWETLIENTRAVGAEHSVFSTDLGQRDNPPVEDGLAAMADRFLEAGFSESEVRVMAVENTRRLARL
jgi:hypothetical protein